MKIFSCILFLVLLSVGFCGQLYGLKSPIDLVSIDPKTAQTTIIGHVITHEAFGENLGCIDQQNGIYYFMGTNLTDNKIDLVGLDVKTGNIKYEVRLPYASEAFIGVSESMGVDASTGDVITIGRDPAQGFQHHLLRVTPTTGNIQSLNVFNFIDFLGGASVLGGNTFWVQLAVNQSGQLRGRLMGYDIITGNQVFEIDDEFFTGQLNWDPNKQVVYGLGLKAPTYKIRIVVQLNPENGLLTELFSIPSQYWACAPMTTIDPDNTLLYYFINDGKRNTPFTQLAVNYSTQLVTYSPTSCTNLAECVWDIEYDTN
ncbi:hypothetical protein M0812_29444 [Anaeramoeba flamelloides]|uniref:Uncharacterized protein n=1 Tax=Anaeramoeba flamelloides TaxID=1746091 RepID=A0AAV7Y3X4_9EUKA|nr:hypothetical protein M0812_29444 [Anaeramoeba flamelloides]